MNAKELADLIGLCGDGGYNQDAATMLRKQAEEIEYWKDKFNKAMQMQEPVSKAKDRFHNYESICLQCGITIYKPQFKTLTDEEMISIYEKDWSGIKCGLGRAVEQAILRKAQEK